MNAKLRAQVDDSGNVQLPASAMRDANLEEGDWVLVWPDHGYLILMPVHSILADYAGSISGLGAAGARRESNERDQSAQPARGSSS